MTTLNGYSTISFYKFLGVAGCGSLSLSIYMAKQEHPVWKFLFYRIAGSASHSGSSRKLPRQKCEPKIEVRKCFELNKTNEFDNLRELF